MVGHKAKTTIFGRLRDDRGGNVLAIMAAAMIPIIAMVGSGIDMTRAYMAQNRFRQACDAGSLAGRRLLSGLAVTEAAREEAARYFAFNFPQGAFKSAPYTLTMTVPTAGTLKIATETTVPTTLMKMFGFDTLPVHAECAATQDFINTDIMLVFDLSGSMNCAPGGSGDCGGIEASNSKIGALRTAAISLYDTLEPAQTQLYENNLRLRYGFVNYNSSVNVGRLLYQKNPDWLVESATYRSRTPNWIDARAIFIGKSACEQAYNDQLASKNGYTGFMGGWWLTGNNCQVIGQTKSLPSGYTYEPRTLDVRAHLASNLAATGATNPVPIWPIIGTNAPNDDRPYIKTSIWNGCIEERQTNATAIDGGNATAAPLDAYDLDIDMIPNSDATRWKPMWGDIAWRGNNQQPDAPCPTEARRLRNYHQNRASFVDYVNGLRAQGNTYHDLGVIWGARLISGTGIFRSSTPETNDINDPDNPEKIRGFSVKKYMIFMTDGEMAPTTTVYSAYGIETLDRRVLANAGNNNTNLTRRHLQRFRMACNAAKSKGIDVWVIAFATKLTTDMERCASKPDQAASLSTNAALIAKFEEIGSKIGSLRLSE